MERLLKSGDGWRIGWHPHGDQYQGLIGGQDWAIELTKAELTDFERLLSQLVDAMEQMADELMEQEKISCEAETSLLWMEVEGYPHSYCLRIILNGDRRCEGNWGANIAPQLIKAVRSFGFAENVQF
ncbi:MAG: DUF1818 family protein [Waterburya sp.]